MSIDKKRRRREKRNSTAVTTARKLYIRNVKKFKFSVDDGPQKVIIKDVVKRKLREMRNKFGMSMDFWTVIAH